MPRPRPDHDLAVAERRAVVATMITNGRTYREIASALRVAVSTVHADKSAIIAEWRKQFTESIGDQASVDLARVEVVIGRLFDELDRGTDPARTAMAIMAALKRRAAILGFDARDRAVSGLRLHLDDAEITDDDHDLAFDASGRPIGKGHAARIYAAFASAPAPEEPDPDTPDVSADIAEARALTRRPP